MLGERIAVLMHIMQKSSNGANQTLQMKVWYKTVFDDVPFQLHLLLSMSPHKMEYEKL